MDKKIMYEDEFGVSVIGVVNLDYTLLIKEVEDFLFNSDLKDYAIEFSNLLANSIIDFYLSYDNNLHNMVEELISTINDVLEKNNNKYSYEIRYMINEDKFKSDLTAFLYNSFFLRNNKILNLIKQSGFNIFPGKDLGNNIKEILLGV